MIPARSLINMKNIIKSTLLVIAGGIAIGIAVWSFMTPLLETVQDNKFEKQMMIRATTQAKAPFIPVGTATALYDLFNPVPAADTAINSLDNQINQNEIPTPSQQVHQSFIPDRIVIKTIGVDAPIIASQNIIVEINDQWFEQWDAPNYYAVGWLDKSVPIGSIGNTVLSGHHNVDGEVFRNLSYLQVEDEILIYSGSKVFTYRVAVIKLLNERDTTLENRKANAKWIDTTVDERITLITCWPKRNNTHRLIVVAYPVKDSKVS